MSKRDRIRYRLSDWLEDLSQRVMPQPEPMTWAQMAEAQQRMNEHMQAHVEALKRGFTDAFKQASE